MPDPQTSDYAVVFEYTSAAGPHKGVRVISYFDSKEHFEKLYDAEWQKTEEVVGQGVSEPEAQRLLRGMSIGGLARATLHEISAGNRIPDDRAREMATFVLAMCLRDLWGLKGRPIREV